MGKPLRTDPFQIPDRWVVTCSLHHCVLTLRGVRHIIFTMSSRSFQGVSSGCAMRPNTKPCLTRGRCVDPGTTARQVQHVGTVSFCFKQETKIIQNQNVQYVTRVSTVHCIWSQNRNCKRLIEMAQIMTGSLTRNHSMNPSYYKPTT